MRRAPARNSIPLIAALCLACLTGAGNAKDMIDYFLPIPNTSPLTSNTWGDPNVLPRDTTNGLETPNKSFFYWDGKVIKTKDGKYHLHCSRWPKNGGFNQWASSITVHAISESLLGPYIDKGPIYSRNSSRGHNVSNLELPDGSFAVYTSDITPGDFYTAPAIEGPWTFKGSMNINYNGYNIPWPTANICVIVRPDSTFLATQRSGYMYVGGKELLGPYITSSPCVWPTISGLDNSRAEDPVLWYSGGYYHITVNWWDSRIAHHLMSKDGVTGWKDMGVAYDPRAGFIRYTNGTVNKWNNLERPGVVMENGHVVAFTFAATDIDKSSITGTDNHCSKIIVVPFDGVAFDADNGGSDAVGPGKNARHKGVYLKTSLQSRERSLLSIEYSIPQPEQVIVTVHDLSGKKIAVIVNKHLNAGKFYQTLNADDISHGCKVIKLRAGANTEVRVVNAGL